MSASKLTSSQSVFEWTNISPRMKAKGHIVESVNETEPDLSESRAMSTVTGYLSGVSPSLLAFIVFGTTKTFQRKMYKTFVPKVIRKKIARCRKRRHGGGGGDDDNDDDFACRHAEGRLPFSSSSAAGSSFARASTLVIAPPPPPLDTKSIGSTSSPTTPRTPGRGSLRPPERASFLLPIQEPSKKGPAAAVDEVEMETQNMPHRRSQIGVAVSGTPEPLEEPQPVLKKSRGRRSTFGTVGTFFRDDSLESLQQIPLSRFNVSKHNNGGDGGLDELQMTSSNRQIPGQTHSFASTTTIWSEGRSVSGEHRALGRTRFGSVS